MTKTISFKGIGFTKYNTKVEDVIKMIGSEVYDSIVLGFRLIGEVPMRWTLEEETSMIIVEGFNRESHEDTKRIFHSNGLPF